MPRPRSPRAGLSGLYHANVTVHLLAAMLWLGGTFFLAVVGAPVLRRVEPPPLRAELFRRLGARFRAVGWIAIGVLLVTGLANLGLRGLLDAQTLGSAAFWQGRYGQALAWKLALVTAMVALAAAHDFVFGPRAARLAPGSSEALAAGRRAAWIARLNAGLGVAPRSRAGPGSPGWPPPSWPSSGPSSRMWRYQRSQRWRPESTTHSRRRSWPTPSRCPGRSCAPGS